MPSANLFWTHPFGDPTMVPCVHRVAQHPGGDVVDTPFGKKTVPCVHIVPLHPGGDPGPIMPCVHPLAPVSTEWAGKLIFFTDNADVQNAAREGVSRLKALGVDLLWPRPLNIFNREPINGNPCDNTDPFWSHYDPITHSIQITRGSETCKDLREVMHHEMGHALVGHKCVAIPTPGSPHSLTGPTDPAEAVSEGWAHFVALAIEKNPSDSAPRYEGMDWERLSIPPNAQIEYCVGACLWDLFDQPTDGITLRQRDGSVVILDGNDRVTLPFTELFRVFSPSLQTLPDGPVMADVNDYLNRLKQNNPAQAAAIDTVKAKNVG